MKLPEFLSHRCQLVPRLLIVLGAICSAAPTLAQGELKDIPDPDPEIERQSFLVADGFEVNLYAADPLLAKPIQMNFDAQGRLWVASSEVYPQVKPGEVANDKILVLEDANGDGRADKTTIFAQGLLIPTGVEPGDGGAYVANSTELVHFKDTDGDLKADERRVVLSGFGTEDTHHILHTLRWGHDGILYFNQSIYIHSHIETPYGVRRLNGGGTWQLRPETMQLEIFFRGLVNHWGHHFDYWGQSFATDGAGGEGINYVFPGAMLVTAPGASKILQGLNPGSPKHCGLEILSGRHLPEDWVGSMITNDFRAHRVCRFAITEDKSGYASREQGELIKTSHPAFRPIDVKVGPDGAIYIADWYNPIIQHGEVDFRDPRRDHTHGRIWRVTAKGRPLVERPQIVGASTEALLEMLKLPEAFTRLHAKLQLKARGAEVLPAVAAWVSKLDPADPQFEHNLLEGLWTYQTLDVVEPELLATLLKAQDAHARAAATRVLSAWLPRLPNAASLLAVQISDANPRVRLEALRALAGLQSSEAAELAVRVLDQPTDRFLEHALFMTIKDLQPQWLPALQSGAINFGGNPTHLTYVLQTAGVQGVVAPLMSLLRSGKLPPERQAGILVLIAALGGPPELAVIFDMAMASETDPALRVELLGALLKASEQRKLRPAGDLNRVVKLLTSPDERVQVIAARAAGAWKLEPLRQQVLALATAQNSSPVVRQAALDGLSSLGGPASRDALLKLTAIEQPIDLRMDAASSLATVDLDAAAGAAAQLLVDAPAETDPAALIVSFMQRKGATTALAAALAGKMLPTDVAKRALRTVRGAAREETALAAALTSAGGITAGAAALTPEALQSLVADVASQGNAARGEAVFRRQEQGCLKCHAISGSGGRVGPDLVSIGASAQVDYLVESILLPSAKIKENYNSLLVTTDEGKVLGGVKVRETDKDLILRDAEDREIAIPLTSIDEQANAGSLMPVGLADSLTRSELVDLVRFLSELGKVGPYSTNKARVVRRWQMLLNTPEAVARLTSLGVESVLKDDRAWQWASVYSQVSGALPVASLVTVEVGRPPQPLAIVRCQVEVSTPGAVSLMLAGPAVQKIWIDSQAVEVKPQMTAELSTGMHSITLVVDANQAADALRLELGDVAGSAAQVQIVGGK